VIFCRQPVFQRSLAFLKLLIWNQERTTKNCSAMPLGRRIYIQRYIRSLSWHRYAPIKVV
jgi:hypothetical protein